MFPQLCLWQAGSRWLLLRWRQWGEQDGNGLGTRVAHTPCEAGSHLRNWAPVGPSAMILLARPSSSASGGGVLSFWGLTRRQVIRVGAAQVRGGITTLRPLWRLPLMEPPRASTMKLTRNLEAQADSCWAPLSPPQRHGEWVPESCVTHPVWTGLATGLMLSEVSVAGLLGMSESSSYSLDA